MDPSHGESGVIVTVTWRRNTLVTERAATSQTHFSASTTLATTYCQAVEQVDHVIANKVCDVDWVDKALLQSETRRTLPESVDNRPRHECEKRERKKYNAMQPWHAHRVCRALKHIETIRKLDTAQARLEVVRVYPAIVAVGKLAALQVAVAVGRVVVERRAQLLQL